MTKTDHISDQEPYAVDKPDCSIQEDQKLCTFSKTA